MSCIATEEKNMLSELPTEVADAVSVVSFKHKLSELDVLGWPVAKRKRNIVAARAELIRYMYVDLEMGYAEIARILRCDHTTVIHSCRKSGIKTRPRNEKKRANVAVVSPISAVSVIPVVAACQEYIVLLGGRRMKNAGQKRGDCLLTWSSGKQEFISEQDAQEFASLMDWRVK